MSNSPQKKKNQKPIVETFIRVTERMEDDGVRIFTNSKGVDVALRLPKTGRAVDLRLHPPFLSMIPCPFCGTTETASNGKTCSDKGHNPLLHTDPFLGEKV